MEIISNQVNELKFIDLSGLIIVQEADVKEINITVTYKDGKKVEEPVLIYEEDNFCVIDGKENKKIFKFEIPILKFKTTIMHNVRIVILVPAGQIKKIVNYSHANVQINDWNSELMFLSMNSGDVHFNGEGVLSLENIGTGDVKIERSSYVKLNSTGSGDVNVNHVVKADISSMGNGDYNLKYIQSLYVQNIGNGDFDVCDVIQSEIINAGNGEFQLVNFNNSDFTQIGNGDISFNFGKELVLKHSGHGEVDLDQVSVLKKITN